LQPFLTRKQNKVNTLSYKTKSASKHSVTRSWYIVDATDMIVGRMCTRIATVLRGKHRADFTPHVDCGDYIIVINAEKIKFTGNKLEDKKYITFSGYPGGQKSKTAKQLLNSRPIRVVENAVRGMLPKNKLGRAMFKKMFVYEGAEHPHLAQKPQTLEIK